MPPARTNASIAYDSALNKVVMFGGSRQDGQSSGDLWEWDGQNWVEMSTTQLPTPRAGALMVYDDSRNEMVLFGGYDQKDGNFTFYSETWTFDGVTWRKENPSHTPLNGDGAPQSSIAYDGARKQVVLWQPFFGAWIWNGADWSQFKGVNEQPLSVEEQLGYDEKNRTLLLWGFDSSKNSSFPPENWIFNGDTWEMAKEGMNPGPKSPEATILYDSKQQKLILVAFLGANGGQETISSSKNFSVICYGISQSISVPSAAIEAS